MFDNYFSFYGILTNSLWFKSSLSLIMFLSFSSIFFISLSLCATFWVKSLGIFLLRSITISYVTSKLSITLKHSNVLFNILHTHTHILEEVSALNSCTHQEPNVYWLIRRIPKIQQHYLCTVREEISSPV